RDCIWVMRAGANGLPDPSNIQSFVMPAEDPVDLEIGPGGDLYYVDLGDGPGSVASIHRIKYFAANQPPLAVATATPSSGASPLTVQLDASGSSDPDPGDTLTYSWDLDGDGTFGDATGVSVSHTYDTPGAYDVRVQVTDN